MRFQTMLEGAECVRHSDAGWQSVPGTRRSDEKRAVTNIVVRHEDGVTRADVDEDRSLFLVSTSATRRSSLAMYRTMHTSEDENREFKLYPLWHP